MPYQLDEECSEDEIDEYDLYTDSGEWKKVWEYHKEADHLYHNRFNFFLVAESMLIVSFVTILTIKSYKDYLLILFSIALLGLIYTCIWYLVNLRLMRKLWFLKNRFLERKDKIYRNYMFVNDKINPYYRSKKHLEHKILPLATHIFWFILVLFILDLQRFWIFGLLVGILFYQIIDLIIIIKLPDTIQDQ